MRSFFTVTRKVAFGYLAIILFALLAVGYALVSLHYHNQRTTQLVGANSLRSVCCAIFVRIFSARKIWKNSC